MTFFLLDFCNWLKYYYISIFAYEDKWLAPSNAGSKWLEFELLKPCFTACKILLEQIWL